MKRLLLIPLLFLWVPAAVAASPIIVDGHYVAEAIARNAVVWDVRAADAYARADALASAALVAGTKSAAGIGVDAARQVEGQHGRGAGIDALDPFGVGLGAGERFLQLPVVDDAALL